MRLRFTAPVPDAPVAPMPPVPVPADPITEQIRAIDTELADLNSTINQLDTELARRPPLLPTPEYRQRQADLRQTWQDAKARQAFLTKQRQALEQPRQAAAAGRARRGAEVRYRLTVNKNTTTRTQADLAQHRVHVARLEHELSDLSAKGLMLEAELATLEAGR